MSDWTKEEIQKIWEKATIVVGYNPNLWRKDQCGAWIYRLYYGAAIAGEAHTSYRWQIDHIKPQSKDGQDLLSNARPLQWYNNDSRQNGRLKTKITSVGNKNVEIENK